MKASDLKYKHEMHNPSSKFFTRETMRFFGDTMSNFGVREGTSTWILYTKKPTKAGYREYHFDKETFKRLHNYK